MVSLDWWDGTAWVPFSDQTFNAATDSVTITVNATTSPTLAELTGTQIAVSTNPGPSLGYWEVASDGGIFAFGGAGFYGSEGGQSLNKPIVGVAGTPDGKGTGRWRRTAGSSPTGTPGSSAPRAVSCSTSRSSASRRPGRPGLLEVASDGGIFAYGEPGSSAPPATCALNKPIVGIASTPDGKGYWLVASDGGIFAFGDAGFYGSDRRPAAQQADRRHPPPRRQGLLVVARTAASSPSATPSSTARRPALNKPDRRHRRHSRRQRVPAGRL